MHIPIFTLGEVRLVVGATQCCHATHDHLCSTTPYSLISQKQASHSWSVGFALIDLLAQVGRLGAVVNWKRRRKLQDKFQAALLPAIGRLDGLQVRTYCDGERRIGNVLLVRDGRE
nr:hypothetical protein Iba_chr10fCG9280 [Ipomoea batatas]